MRFQTRIATGLFRLWVGFTALMIVVAVAGVANWTDIYRYCPGPVASTHNVRIDDGRTFTIVAAANEKIARSAAEKRLAKEADDVRGQVWPGQADNRYILLPQIVSVETICDSTRWGYASTLAQVFLKTSSSIFFTWLAVSVLALFGFWTFRGFFPRKST